MLPHEPNSSTFPAAGTLPSRFDGTGLSVVYPLFAGARCAERRFFQSFFNSYITPILSGCPALTLWARRWRDDITYGLRIDFVISKFRFEARILLVSLHPVVEWLLSLVM